MLYKNVFKLPDVEYSVEAMLHGITDGYSTEEYGHNHIVLDDGRAFQLDEPGECGESGSGRRESARTKQLLFR